MSMTNNNPEVVDYVRLKLSQLQLHPKTMKRADFDLEKSVLRGKDVGKRLHKEWVNDALQNDTIFAEACAAPDAHFLSYVAFRIKNPFHVSYRTIARAARLYGLEFVNRMVIIKWDQEIAWSERLRADDNDRVAILSFLFHRGVLTDPCKSFLGLCDTYMNDIAAGILPSDAHPNNLLTPADILAGHGEQGWTPIFLSYAERTVGKDLLSMDKPRMAAIAGLARKTEEAARQTRLVRDVVAKARLHPLSHLPGLIIEALRRNLSSNKLVGLERAFLSEVEAGHIAITKGDLYSAFFRYLGERTGDDLPVPEQSEALRRLDSIRAINNEWLSGLSDDLKQFGGADIVALADWRKQVMKGLREAPIDAYVDYAFFLVEKVLASPTTAS